MGFICPERQTTADFLTSLTSPSERIARDGWEARVPHSPEEFEKRWLESADHARLVVVTSGSKISPTKLALGQEEPLRLSIFTQNISKIKPFLNS
jgi:ATP-binding cassette, subfamily G (WHITE), member 2, PDR